MIRGLAVVLVTACVVGCTAPGGSPGDDNSARRGRVDAAADTALESLYRNNSSAKSLVESAAGYAVFDARPRGGAPGAQGNDRVQVIAGQRDGGVLIDNATRQRTYLTMVAPVAGYGLAYATFQRVIVLQTPEALARFRTAALAGEVPASSAALVIFDLTPGGLVGVPALGAARFAP